MEPITRRSMLKGVSLGASAALLAPMVNQLQAAESGKQPKRFVFVVEGNGLNPQQIQPVGINFQSRKKRENFVEDKLASFELPEALQPLKEYKDRMCIIQGLSGRIAGGGHSNNFGALGAFNGRGGVGRSGQAPDATIDGALAKHLGGVFPHVGLGISDKPEHTVIYNCSAWGPNQQLPTQCRPDIAFGALFGAVAKGRAAEDFKAKNNLLDFMVDDVKRVNNSLPGTEKQKLESYLQAYEAMKHRQSRLNEIKNTLRKHAPVVNNKFASTVETDRLDAHFDIAAAAMIGGLTNVITIASGVGDPYFSVKFQGLGIEVGKHTIGHGGSSNGKTWDQMAIMIRRFHMELIHRMMKKFEAVPEGDGTMLDNTVIVYLSDAAEGHHSRCWEWPYVVIGDMGGRLKTKGRYLCYPKYGHKDHRTTAQLYTTFLHAAGHERKRFGVPDPMLKDIDQDGPLPELIS